MKIERHIFIARCSLEYCGHHQWLYPLLLLLIIIFQFWKSLFFKSPIKESSVVQLCWRAESKVSIVFEKEKSWSYSSTRNISLIVITRIGILNMIYTNTNSSVFNIHLVLLQHWAFGSKNWWRFEIKLSPSPRLICSMRLK